MKSSGSSRSHRSRVRSRSSRDGAVRVIPQTQDPIAQPAAQPVAGIGDDAPDVNEFVAAVVKELGGVHFLINNAGIGRDRALWRMSDEEWHAVLDTNLAGAFYLIRAVALNPPNARAVADHLQIFQKGISHYCHLIFVSIIIKNG